MQGLQLKSAIESLLFINERPLELSELIEILGIDKGKITLALEELTTEYQKRNSGICIVQLAGGYQMCSAPNNEIWVKKMYQERNKHKFSVASLETLAIIAYKQPITRVEIESIRGVNVDGVVRKLTDLGLIKIGGRKEVVGRPFLYITTRKFLEYFGINSLKDLPKLEEFAALSSDKIVGINYSNWNKNAAPESTAAAKNTSLLEGLQTASDIKGFCDDGVIPTELGSADKNKGNPNASNKKKEM